jgi:DNA-binding IclR family transcriptional regulator
MQPDDLRPVDRRILKQMAEHEPEYVPLVANRLGLPLGYAERRCERLIEAGLLEPVTNEVVYRPTEEAQQVLQVSEAAPKTATD